jgi:hypothetical protein
VISVVKGATEEANVESLQQTLRKRIEQDDSVTTCQVGTARCRNNKIQTCQNSGDWVTIATCPYPEVCKVVNANLLTCE